MKVELKTSIRHMVGCPTCGRETDITWLVDRLKQPESERDHPKTTTEQNCADCDTRFVITPSVVDGKLTGVSGGILPTNHRRGLMLVKRPEDDLYLVVETTFHDHGDGPSTDLNYYINEHTCPTNWLPVLMIAENGDPDPHGVFKFVRGVTFAEIKETFGYSLETLRHGCNDQDEALLAIFPEIEFGV